MSTGRSASVVLKVLLAMRCCRPVAVRLIGTRLDTKQRLERNRDHWTMCPVSQKFSVILDLPVNFAWRSEWVCIGLSWGLWLEL